ncbi:MAG: ComF family protein [Pseudomonadota bacterium]
MVSPAHFAKDLKDGIRPLVDLIYPPRCLSCSAAIADHGALCIDCWNELEFASSKDKPATATETGHSEIMAATYYNDMSRDLILKFKHGGKLALAPLLGRMMASRICNEAGEIPLIVPVPLHRTRIWQRGFNQSAMLAREIAKAGCGELKLDALIRKKRTPSLGNMSADQRRGILAGAIDIRPRAKEGLAGRQVILVDDVLTSGATSDACANALLNAQAQSVQIVCFARADRWADSSATQ